MRNYAPRLNESALTLNTKTDAGVSTSLLASYGNAILEVEVFEYSTAARAYDYSAVSGNFSAFYDESLNRLNINSSDELPNGSAKVMLRVRCANNMYYYLPLTIVVKNSVPTISVKQGAKFELFYKDSSTILTVSVPSGETISGIELLDNPAGDTFNGSYLGSNEAGADFKVTYSEAKALTASNQAYNKVKLRVYLEGFFAPVEKDVTIATVLTKPKYVLSSASSVINTAIGVPEIFFTIYDKTAKRVLNLDTEVTCTDDGVTVATDLAADTVALTWNRSSGGRATVSVQNDNWAQPISFTHSVTVQSTLPTAKLSASALKLSNIYTDVTADASLILSQTGVSVKDVTFESTAKGTALAEAEKLELSYADGVITAGIKDGETPKAGTYSFKVTTWIEGQTADVALRAVTLKVSVAATAPQMSLASSTLKLNSMYIGEVAASDVKLSLAGYEVTDVTAAKASSNKLSNDDISIWLEDGVIKATLDNSVAKGTYSYLLTPTVKHVAAAQEVDLAPITLKVNVYSSAAVSAAVSASGKLDAVNRESSAITYTVTKLSNITGMLQNPVLMGADADKFELSELSENAKGQPTVALKLKVNEDYRTNVTYKVQLGFDVEGIAELQVKSPVLSVKVSQSALKLSVNRTVATLFQSNVVPQRFIVNVVTPVGVEIAKVSVNSATTLALRQAIGACEFAPNGEVSISIANASRLKAGGSYSLVLDVTPEGMATNIKPTQLKLTIKTAK